MTGGALLDPDHYAACYGGQLRATGLDPAAHFARHGAAAGLCPNARVDPVVHALMHHGGDVEAAVADLHSAPDTTTDADDLRRLVPMQAGRGLRIHASDTEQTEGFVEAGPIAPDRARVLGERADWSERAGPITYRFHAPAADTFIDDIRAGHPVTFVKLPHGLWDSAAHVRRLAALLDGPPFDRLTPAQTTHLAIRWAALLTPRIGNFTEGFFDDFFLHLGALDRSAGLSCGLALVGYPALPDGEGAARAPDPTRTLDRFTAISEHFPSGTAFHDGTLFKRWVASGDLGRLFGALADRPCLLVGPKRLDCLGARAGLSRLDHYVIADAGSQRDRYRILREVTDRVAALPGGDPVVICQCGGALAFWLLTHLRQAVPHGTFLDMGQALNGWALDRVPTAKWLRVYARAVVGNNGLTDIYGGPAAAGDLIARFEAH